MIPLTLRDLAFVAPKGGAAFEPETDTLIAALTGSYDSPRQDAINTLIAALKTGATSGSNILAKQDVLCVAGLNSADSLINWKTPGTLNSSAINSPTFVADRGFTAEAAGSRYINTNYNPTSVAGNYTQNSASVGVYSRTESAETTYDFGWTTSGSSRVSLLGRRVDNACFWRINDVTETNTAGNTSSLGLTTVTRTGASARAIYRDASQLGTSTISSAGVPDGIIYVGARNFADAPQSITTRQYAAWFMGGGLSGAEITDLYNALQAYLTYIGANV